MESLPIVEDIDVESNRLPGMIDGRECGAVDQLILQRREERFRQRTLDQNSTASSTKGWQPPDPKLDLLGNFVPSKRS